MRHEYTNGRSVHEWGRAIREWDTNTRKCEPSTNGGDGTVPLTSCSGQFLNEPLVDLKLVSSGNSTHTGLMSDLVVQEQILDKLGVAWTTVKIQTGTGLALLTSLSVIKDPVDRFLVDGLGRRLGHSADTGPLAEIPASQWFGGLDGFGFIDGPVAEPLHLELTGLDQEYYVMVSVDRFGIPYGGVISSGFLTQGQQISEPVDLLFSSFLPLVNR